MIKKVVPVTDPCLRKKSKPVKKVDKKVRQLIQDLKDTIVIQTDPEGIGLAAPQIGKNSRVFVIKPEDEISAFINPEIIKIYKEKKKHKSTKETQKHKKKSKKSALDHRKSEKKGVMEGCLSIPHYYGPIRRVQKVQLKYLNEKGEKIEEIFEGLKAQIIMHEIDHLNGVLFIDRLLEQKQKLYELVDGEWEEVDLII